MSLPWLYVGWPWKREVPARCAVHQFEWVMKASNNLEAFGQVGSRSCLGNYIAVNRSLLFDSAKQVQALAKKRDPEADLFFTMLDSDSMPFTPAAEALKIVREDFDDGYGLVLAPVHNLLQNDPRKQPVVLEDWSGTRVEKPNGWEANGSMSWAWVAPEVLRRLTPVGNWKHIEASSGEPPVPMYTYHDSTYSEDVRLSLRVAELGFKTFVDKRLDCGHFKETVVPGIGGFA